MTHVGYALSSEEHTPADLVRNARLAEEVGFEFALISDHYHPWIDAQGHSPFVWSVIGAIAQATGRLELGTGVTAPTVRIHPAIVAQAAATASLLAEGRFFLGVGSGENLNEHILGDRWPPASMRLEMVEEAVGLMRELWRGELTTHYGEHYVVENARIYDRPADPLPVMVAASGDESAALAGRIGDGLVSTAPKREVVEAFERAGGGDKPRYGQLTMCWAPDRDDAIETALRQWPNSALPGQLSQDLALPLHFEQAASLVRADQIAEMMPCGPDARPVLDKIASYADAGYSHVYLHQVGPQQEGFLRFCEREILPELSALAGGARTSGR